MGAGILQSRWLAAITPNVLRGLRRVPADTPQTLVLLQNTKSVQSEVSL